MSDDQIKMLGEISPHPLTGTGMWPPHNQWPLMKASPYALLTHPPATDELMKRKGLAHRRWTVLAEKNKSTNVLSLLKIMASSESGKLKSFEHVTECSRGLVI